MNVQIFKIMATIKFLLQSKANPSNIYVRFSAGRNSVFKRKTGLFIDPKDWSSTKAMPNPKDTTLKDLKTDLEELRGKILKAHNSAVQLGEEIDGNWLQNQIEIANNKNPNLNNDLLVNQIQEIIDNSASITKQNGEIGLSSSRVKGYKTLQGLITRFQTENEKYKSIFVKSVNIDFVESLKKWMLNKKYSIGYVGKTIDNLKAACNYAKKNDIQTSLELDKIIRLKKNAKTPKTIVYLSEEEQNKIAKIKLKREALDNARKWLLLGCLIGQRGGDLLNITPDNIVRYDDFNAIELTQQKTGKYVKIPLIPEAEEILKDGFPYKISIQKFNEYIKEVCKEAGLLEPIEGIKRQVHKKDKKLTAYMPRVKGTYPKYKLVGSHICRRSFATNFYGKIPTPILINITAHENEKVFKIYIGKTTDDYMYDMMKYYSDSKKKKPKSNQKPHFEVIKNTSNG